MGIKTIGILGAGVMGNGIAQVAAQAGYDVVMRDLEDKFVERAFKNITKFLAKSVEKGKMTEEQKGAVLGKIKGTTKIEDMKDVDFVIEVVDEVMDTKKKVFAEMDALVRPEVIIASNTSSMSLTEIATVTKRPDKILGLHFFNPVPLMRLVEVIRGVMTSDDSVSVALDLTRKLGKEPIEVKVDIPGFVVNRLMIPHFVEAIKLYEAGIASKEDIDKAAKMGLNYPMGPFELMDLTGIDIGLHVTQYFHDHLPKELKWDPPLIMENMVRAGRIGMKVGAGWYDYPRK